MNKLLENPFRTRRLLKLAEVNGVLRSAESAVRKAEAARRKSLETHIDRLNKAHQATRQQATDAQQQAMLMQQSTMAAAPPAAQPVYGNAALAMAQPQQAQGGNGSKPKTPTLPGVPGQSQNPMQ